MIDKNCILEKFYRDVEEFERNSHLTPIEALRINGKLCEDAAELGIITSENIMDGFEATLRVARAINGLKYDDQELEKFVKMVRSRWQI